MYHLTSAASHVSPEQGQDATAEDPGLPPMTLVVHGREFPPCLNLPETVTLCQETHSKSSQSQNGENISFG